ncbi:MAG: DUF4259 domain-containing protein [Acidimicrobiales bacterium]
MGAWGTAIFSDDVAADVRADWQGLIADGLTPEEATNRILADYAEYLEDPDDRSVVLLALAVSQWQSGRLQPAVRDAALEVINSGVDLERWERPADRRARAGVLDRTKDLLESPQPAAKRPRRRIRSETPFRPGDLFAYRHNSGRYFAFWVSRNWEDHGGVYSDVELLRFSGDSIPSLDMLASLPAMTREWAPKADGTTNPPEPAGFVLLHAAQMSTLVYEILGNVPRPVYRPAHLRTAVEASSLDRELDRYLGALP